VTLSTLGDMYARYVALGDSSTEGLDDPDGAGGYRGWADRLAEALANPNPGLLYANLAIRGRLAGQVRAEQLDRALELQPDVTTVFAGVNDLLRPGFDVTAVVADVEHMQRALVDAGATVLTFTMPDPSRVLPVVKWLRPRVDVFNDALREAAARSGARLVDVGAYPVAGDPRLWAEDRLHANAVGHARIAAALADALGLPGSDGSWTEPLPLPARRRPHQVVRAELAWTRRHLLPWVARRLRGESSGDGVQPKRPELAPVTPFGGGVTSARSGRS
jgi:lysophospholipase L1-like esterase